MNVLGLNAYHADASSALIQDGRLVAAAEEERFRRIKHWAGLPTLSAAWCLADAGLNLSNIDILAVNRDPRAALVRKGLYVLRSRPSAGLVLDRLRNLSRVESISKALERGLAESGAAGAAEFRGTVRRVEHHVAHQASAFLVSPHHEAALLSIDGFGDFSSASWGIGLDGAITIDGRTYFPHSLGAFYLAVTQYLGFPRYGDEYKVMGLAPFGEPVHMQAMRGVLLGQTDGTFRLDLSYFRHQDEDLEYRWDGVEPTVGNHFSPALEDLLGPARRPGDPLGKRQRDIARSAQVRFEEAVLSLLEMVHTQHPVDAVVLSGGAAMNSAMNGRVIPRSPFKQVFIPPAPGDSGGALGAALMAWYDATGAGRGPAMVHSSYGCAFDAADCSAAVAARSDDLSERGCRTERAPDDDVLCATVAEAVADGLIVGWFQGRMEFGPRALGHRSILGDPRRSDMRDRINAKIKLREPFRPFAPSILRERMAEWFEVDDDVPFMMKVYAICPEKRELVPAVTHVDGTGRAQTVTVDAHPLYHRLIRAFEERTGVPMVLNTSFNENEPIIRRPEEALDCFLRTDMDMIALGHEVIRKGTLSVETAAKSSTYVARR